MSNRVPSASATATRNRSSRFSPSTSCCSMPSIALPATAFSCSRRSMASSINARSRACAVKISKSPNVSLYDVDRVASSFSAISSLSYSGINANSSASSPSSCPSRLPASASSNSSSSTPKRVSTCDLKVLRRSRTIPTRPLARSVKLSARLRAADISSISLFEIRDAACCISVSASAMD